MKLRLLPLGMATLWCCSNAFAATVDFVQITDPHIFDCKGDVEGNKEALKWCINEINGRLGPSADYRFVVVTGDLGLEGLPCGGNEKEPAPAVSGKAQELADIIKESKVKQWLFLPGNNDLVGENPADIGTFHRFIDALKGKAPPEMQIVDFCPRDGDSSSGVLDIGGCRFIGFNNASFKSNDSADHAKRFEAKQSTNVDEVIARLAEPRFKSAYIFYHIPEIDDPYCISLDPTKPADNEILKKRETSRGEIGKEYPCSAWTVTSLVRDKWNRIVGNDRVQGLFAGHFHSAEEESYLGLEWIRSTGYAPASLLKLQVCPPVASKKQEDKQTQARGFREVSVDCEKKERKSQVIWYRRDSGQKFKIIEKDLVLSVDGNNAASGLIHFSNPTEKEISLSLSADDFKSSNGDYGLNTKVLLALPSATSAGQQVLETKLPPSTAIAVKIDLSNFWEAGEATANLRNFGEPIGKIRAAKWRPSFAVKIVSATPDKPEFSFTKGESRQIVLKNEDAMTYPVVLSAEVDGIQSESSRVVLPPNSSVPVQLKSHDDWFPASAGVKEIVRDGTIRIQWQAPRAGNLPLPERVIPFKAHLNSMGEFWQTFWNYLFVLIFVTLGGVCSMILSNWVPNRLARADIDEDLSDLARATTALSQRIDSGLRVLLRVERNRLHRLVRSEFILSANYPNIVKKAREQMAVLSQQVELAGEIDRARQRLEPLIQANPIPFKIERIDADLQNAADRLRRLSCTNADTEAANTLIKTATDRIDKMTAPDDELVTELKSRIERLNEYVKAPTVDGSPDPAFDELKRAFLDVFTSFGKFTAENVQPGEYSPIDLVTAQLQAIREYQQYYNAGIQPPPPFPRAQESAQHFALRTFEGFRRARRFLNELREGIPPETIEEALKNGQAEILITPQPVEHQPAQFTISFRSEILDSASARDEFRCEWDFGDKTLKETGWEVYHYFREPKDHTVTATFFRKNAAMPAQTSALPNPKLQKPLQVSKPAPNPSADRNVAEFVRLGIALFIALIGLLAGAREQLTKLDFAPAAVAVFLLGFGADTIKNLISPKQAETKSR